jgi:hypothetical protein
VTELQAESQAELQAESQAELQTESQAESEICEAKTDFANADFLSPHRPLSCFLLQITSLLILLC